MVFSRHISYFFEPDRPELFRVLRAADRRRMPQTASLSGTSSDAEAPNYYFESLGRIPAPSADAAAPPIAPYVAEFLPAATTRAPRAHRHAGREFLYMLSGTLQLTHDGQPETLDQGDAVYFDADSTHSYERVGAEDCAALILTLPEPAGNTPVRSNLPLSKESGARKK
jgi:mannose-6-phosphate isomerase-like protein (cupin superfamily)